MSGGSRSWSASARWAAAWRMTDERDGGGQDDGGGGREEALLERVLWRVATASLCTRVWMSRDSPRATTTTIGLRGLHCCPSFVTGFALAHRVLTDQALYLAALRQRHVLQLGESSAAADGSCTFKLKQRQLQENRVFAAANKMQIQLVSVSCAEIRVSPVESILDGRLDGYCKCA
nr:uncharacterized protein LOC127341459 isoform X2 [Lolium perenne]